MLLLLYSVLPCSENAQWFNSIQRAWMNSYKPSFEVVQSMDWFMTVYLHYTDFHVTTAPKTQMLFQGCLPRSGIPIWAFQKWVIQLNTNWHWQNQVFFTVREIQAIDFWRLKAFLRKRVPVWVPYWRKIITKDACLTGWGAEWCHRYNSKHNQLELRTNCMSSSSSQVLRSWFAQTLLWYPAISRIRATHSRMALSLLLPF